MSAEALQAATILAERAGEWSAQVPKPLVIGLCGSQGSGKSTIAAQAAERLCGSGLRTVVLSLDDFYLRLDERRRLALDVHPLFAVRGPPGTHDVGLVLDIIAALRAEEPVRMPRFDKLLDDRLPHTEWALIEGRVDVILFEGWCVGAVPQPADALGEPVNALERNEDPHAIWRIAVNTALAGPYASLFGSLDRLAMLKPPSFEVVQRWRLQQEEANAAGADAAWRAKVMDAVKIARFIQHYERLTCWMLTKVPARADLVIELNDERQVVGAS